MTLDVCVALRKLTHIWASSTIYSLGLKIPGLKLLCYLERSKFIFNSVPPVLQRGKYFIPLKDVWPTSAFLFTT